MKHGQGGKLTIAAGLEKITGKVKRAEKRVERGVHKVGHVIAGGREKGHDSEKEEKGGEDGAACGLGDGEGAGEGTAKFRMPPDATLEKMTVIASRKLRGVSVQDYYDVTWSDKDQSMYGPFLEKQGKEHVAVTPWEADAAAAGEWCGEAYEERRVVTFSFMKQTIGQTKVEVTHTQRRRREGDDRRVVQIRMEMKGFPYADCFVVHVRHVASRVGNCDLSIKIGMYVQFLKSCMFESKIRNNTGAETTKAQVALLEMTLEGCAPYAEETEGSADDGDGDDDDDDNVDDAEDAARPAARLPDPALRALHAVGLVLVLFALFQTYVRPFVPPGLLASAPPAAPEEGLRRTRAGVRALREVSWESAGTSKDVAGEIAAIEEALGRIKKAAAGRR